jgi:streptogramin lyase
MRAVQGEPMSQRMLLAAVLAAAAASPAVRASDDYFISIPAFGAVYRIDGTSGAITSFATGMSIPFYGTFAPDGNLYMPDRGIGVIWKIDPTGDVSPFAAGGWLSSIVTLTLAPGGGFVAADIFQQTVVHIDETGEQTLIADAISSGGLLSGPGGIGYGPDGTLYVANNLSSDLVKVDDATGVVTPFTDAQGLLIQPAGVVVDTAGNLFVASYGTNDIVRVRTDTGVADVFCHDPFLLHPNDVRLAPEGGLHVTVNNAAMVHIDARGQLTVLHEEGVLGPWDGVASPAYLSPCTGQFVPYGAGLAGSGGFVPELRGLFSPCPGTHVGLEVVGLLGGSFGSLAWGLAPLAAPFKQGTLLVNINPPGGLIPLFFPGAGPGGGALTLSSNLPQTAALSGLSIYLQVLAADPGAPAGISMSNGLEERIGS